MGERCSQHGDDEAPWMCECTRKAVQEALHVLEIPRERPSDKLVDVSVAITWLKMCVGLRIAPLDNTIQTR
jgi:hypothetical protein